MELPIGETFKDFRTDKNLSLSEAAGDIVTKSFLSKFERGGTSISFNNLLQLLQRMNVTVSEFLYRAYGYMWTGSAAFFNRLSVAAATGNVEALNKLIQQASTKYTSSGLQSDKVNLIVARSVKLTFEDQSLPNNETSQVLDYLFESEDWLHYDLKVLTYILPFIPPDMLPHVSHALIKHTEEYIRVGINSRIVAEVLLNILARQIELQHLHDAQVLLHDLDRNPTIRSMMMFSINLQSLKAAYEYVSGQTEDGSKEMLWALDTLRHLGSDKLAKRLSTQWQELTGVPTEELVNHQ
ncbi:Rgg/GadR/MutR family transcriptional regulator [Schleiferilactobacillus shenzhenensis]|nr:Rgg/GadR/MutR family transcriptional regulator [Schleiferilactobacillus shenzhenensis]